MGSRRRESDDGYQTMGSGREANQCVIQRIVRRRDDTGLNIGSKDDDRTIVDMINLYELDCAWWQSIRWRERCINWRHLMYWWCFKRGMSFFNVLHWETGLDLWSGWRVQQSDVMSDSCVESIVSVVTTRRRLHFVEYQRRYNHERMRHDWMRAY